MQGGTKGGTLWPQASKGISPNPPRRANWSRRSRRSSPPQRSGKAPERPFIPWTQTQTFHAGEEGKPRRREPHEVKMRFDELTTYLEKLEAARGRATLY